MGFGKALKEALFGEDKYFRPSVATGDPAPESGYYEYKGNPDNSKLPVWPDAGERTIYLWKGQPAPAIRSMFNAPASYKLIVKLDRA
jgi:hypothetical protein